MLNVMWLIINFALDNGEVYRVARPVERDFDDGRTVVTEIVEVVTEGRFLLLETTGPDGHLRRAVLNAQHISSASWQMVEQVPSLADGVLWRPSGAPTD